MRIIIGFFIILATISERSSADSASLVAQALELIQKNEKTKALKLLEQAFEKAVDPEGVKESAILILEASPENYPKREAYLRYLTQRARDHADIGKWFKELGDRSFDRAEFDKAEEFYLSALTNCTLPGAINCTNPWGIKYKLAWTYWNQKRKNEAFSRFMDLVLDSSSISEDERASLFHQLSRDLAKLWWEIGPLPSSSLARFTQSSSEFQSEVFSAFWESFPQNEAPQPKMIEHFKQIQTSFSSEWAAFKARELFFKTEPCFILENVYTENDFAGPRALLACASNPKHPEISLLGRHFEALKDRDEADENFIRAYASLLQEANQLDRALTLMMNWKGFSEATAELKSFCSDLAIIMSDDLFQNLYSSLPQEKWEQLLKNSHHKALLARLQKLDAEKWLRFEETLFAGKEPSHEFALKKLLWLSDHALDRAAELEDWVNKALAKPANAEERSAKSLLKPFAAYESKELPEIFDQKFTKALELWVRGIDKRVAEYQQLSADWQKILQTSFQGNLRNNLDRLLGQIERVTLPETELLEDNDFSQHKQSLKEDLQKKYEEFIRSPV